MAGDIPQELRDMAASVGRDLDAENARARAATANMNRRNVTRSAPRRQRAITETTGPNTWAVTPGRTDDDLTNYRLIAGPGYTS